MHFSGTRPGVCLFAPQVSSKHAKRQIQREDESCLYRGLTCFWGNGAWLGKQCLAVYPLWHLSSIDLVAFLSSSLSRSFVSVNRRLFFSHFHFSRLLHHFFPEFPSSPALFLVTTDPFVSDSLVAQASNSLTRRPFLVFPFASTHVLLDTVFLSLAIYIVSSILSLLSTFHFP